MVEWTFTELEETGSTQAVAKELAEKGAPEGTAVVAKSQTFGEGRLGRRWVSPPGGLYVSFILRPVGLRRPELAALVAAAAVSEGVEEVTRLAATIRWPNDVMVSGKKLAGVIAQAQSSGADLDQIIVGIGINCNASVSGNPGAPDATSVAEQWGRDVEIPLLRTLVLDSFSRLYARWQRGADMTSVWRSRLSTLGKRVQLKLKTGETPFSGTAKDAEEDGALVMKDKSGILHIRPEDLEWLRELE